MLAILLSWAVMAYVLFSLGDIFILLYNKWCKKTNENYNFLDTLLLGMCFATLLVSATSLWLPSNHYILLAYIIICTIYWVVNRKKLKERLRSILTPWKSMSISSGILLMLSVFSLIIYTVFLSDSFDSEYYHQQNIRWNEEYPVIPGLGNLEDRFGFNSNYLLLSALFTFRFLFKDPVYLLQSLLFVNIFVWIFVEFVRSKYRVEWLIALAFCLIILLIDNNMLANTSTDSIPFLCIFYYIVKTTLKPDWLRKQYLLAFSLPVILLTIKISSAIFCLVCLVLIIYLVNKKAYRPLSFLVLFSATTVILWCVRNVIITGYIVYPLPEIDLFSYDWKMPASTALLQKTYIHDFAVYMAKVEFAYIFDITDPSASKIELISKLIRIVAYGLFVLSPFVIIYRLIKKKNINRNVYIVYFISVLCIVYIVATAPDFRFMNGYILGCAFMSTYLILRRYEIKRPIAFGKYALLFITLCIATITYKKKQTMIEYYLYYEKESISKNNILLLPIDHPWSSKHDPAFTEYKMCNISVYIKDGDNLRTYDKLPATNNGGLPFNAFDSFKIQSIYTIECRGDKVEDGFRTKNEYICILNDNFENYKAEYEVIFKKRYRIKNNISWYKF